MNLHKFNKYLEIFWWVMAGVTFIGVTIMVFTESFDKWGSYYLTTVLCLLLAIVRRFLGKRLEKSQAFNANSKKN